MSALTSLGGLVAGISGEAAKIRQEREDKEQQNMKLSLTMLQNIIENPNITNPQLKEEASQALRDITLQHLFPDNYKAKPGKLHKMIEEFVGNATAGGQQQAEAIQRVNGQGLGRGNGGQSPVGGLSQPQQGSMPLPPPQYGDAPTTQQASPDAGGLPPDPNAAGIAGFNPITTASGFQNSDAQIQTASRAQQYNAAAAQKAASASAKQKISDFFEHPQVKALLKDHPEYAQQVLETVASASGLKFTPQNQALKNVDKVTQKLPDGTEERVYIDEATHQVLGRINMGMTSIGDQPQMNTWLDDYVTKHHIRPTEEEIDKHRIQLKKEDSDITEERAKNLAVQRNLLGIDAADIRTGRIEVAKSADDLLDARTRYNLMKKVVDEIGKSENPGSDDQVLLSNHIAMTFGGVKGTRVGKDIIEAHLKARSFPASLEQGVRRWLDGGVLTQAQRNTFVSLAADRLAEIKSAYVWKKKLWEYEPKGDEELMKDESPAANGPPPGAKIIEMDPVTGKIKR